MAPFPNQENLCELISRHFSNCQVRMSTEQEIAGAKVFSDQYRPGEVGHADPKDLVWLEIAAYPLTRLRHDLDAQWFQAERAMWADEGEPDRFDDMLTEPIWSPIIAMDDGNGGYIWDGNHRVAACIVLDTTEIKARVGFKREALETFIQLDAANRAAAAVNREDRAAPAPRS